MAYGPMKRKAASVGGAKRSRGGDKRVSTVVNALKNAETLPENLRGLLDVTLPLVLNANKADRHAYENEVVTQAQQALTAVQGALEQAHNSALANQNAIISNKERANRTATKTGCEAQVIVTKGTLEANKAAKKAAEGDLAAAEAGSKAAVKEQKSADKALEQIASKRTVMSDVLANELVMLQQGTSASAAGRQAVKKLLALAKQHGLDSTLCATLPITCKKEVAARSEFEGMMFDNLKALITGVIDKLSADHAEAEPVAQGKAAAVASADAEAAAAKAALQAASDAVDAAHTAHSEAGKELKKADAQLRKLWEDMREACEAQDNLSDEVKQFKGEVWDAFNQCKEREPEPEPVEEEAAPEPAAAAAADAAMEPTAELTLD